MINILNLFTIPENVALWIIWSAILGLIVFIYWFFTFNKKEVVHIEKKRKLNVWLLFREYHFYVLFVLLALITWFVFIETLNYSIAIILAMALWVFLYLFTWKSQVYNWWDNVEIWDIEIISEKEADERREKAKKEEDERREYERTREKTNDEILFEKAFVDRDEKWVVLQWFDKQQDEWEQAENAGTLKENMIKNLTIWIIGLVIITLLSFWIVHYNILMEAAQSAKDGANYVSTQTTYATYAIIGPLVYSILFWISFTDRRWLVIMDRFMYALIAVWLGVFIYTYPLGVEDLAVLLFFFSIFLIFMAGLERIGIMPPIGYQDIPLMFAFGLLFQFWALFFVVSMLFIDSIEGAVKRVMYGKQKLVKIWMYRYAFLVLIFTYASMFFFNFY